jgi:hypothetical protein
MGNLQDCSINAKPESVYKTAVTPDRAYEFTDESLKWEPNIVQGEGLRAGSFVDRSGRRVVPNGQGSGDITMEIVSKGFGYWWQACLGAGVSTLVSGSTQQQNFTWAKQPSSLTVQKTSVRADGTVDPFTFKGCMVTQFVITFNNAGLVTLQVSLDIGDFDTATGFASLTYPTTPNLFHFGQWTMATGTFTAPTTTALPSAATPLTGVRSLTITGNRNPVDDRFNALGTGRKDQPIGTKFDITGSMDVEYVSTAQRDNFLAQTEFALVSTVTAGALSTGLETLCVALPACKIDDGGTPEANGTGLIVQSIAFTALDNLSAAQPIWVSTRTADAAI